MFLSGAKWPTKIQAVAAEPQLQDESVLRRSECAVCTCQQRILPQKQLQEKFADHEDSGLPGIPLFLYSVATNTAKAKLTAISAFSPVGFAVFKWYVCVCVCVCMCVCVRACVCACVHWHSTE